MSYGYHWWIPWFGGYAARGYAGQAIFVLPSLDMVVVMTGGLHTSDTFLPEWLVQQFILPAAGQAPLPPQPQAFAALTTTIQEQSQDEPAHIPALPPTASWISGHGYNLAPNPAGLHSISLMFQGADEAVVALEQRDAAFEARVGLDRVFRITDLKDGQSVALRGRWVDDATFVLESRSTTTGNRFEMRFVFAGDEVTIFSHGIVQGRALKMRGQRATHGRA